MSNWKVTQLGEVCEIGRGSSPRPKADRRFFEGGTIPWIKIADASSSLKYIYSTEEHVNEFGATFSRRLKPGSLIIATSGVSLGQIKFLGVEGCIHDGWLYCDNYNGINKEFLYYRLLLLWDYFHSKSYGAAIQNINTGILRETEIALPPIETQQRIASMLSAYDDLIENNLRRIKLLENAARCEYKVMMEESDLVNKEIKEVGDVVTGKTPSTAVKSYYGNDVMFVKTPDMHNQVYVMNTDQKLSIEGAESQNNKFIPPNSIMVSCIGTAGVVSISCDRCQTNQQINTIIPNDTNASFFLYFSLKEKKEELEALGSSGATFTNVNKGKFESLKIQIPENTDLNLFHEKVNSSFELIKNLNSQNSQLRQARDILLPRLMSGEIEV